MPSHPIAEKNGPVAPGADHDPSVAFEAVYTDQFEFVWRCLRSLGVPDDAVDDATQDVFLVVHRRLVDFRGQSSLRTWLFAIVRNVASNHRRSLRRKGESVLPWTPEHDAPIAGGGPLERAQDAEAAAFVRAFLDGLDDKKRDIFILAALEEMSIPEVAATLEIPLNTAYTRLRSVRAALAAALARRRRTTP